MEILELYSKEELIEKYIESKKEIKRLKKYEEKFNESIEINKKQIKQNRENKREIIKKTKELEEYIKGIMFID